MSSTAFDTAAHWSSGHDAIHDWALVLAGGEGTRLQSLTTTACGITVPKQFCSLRGGSSLLHDALWRARAVAPPERTCAIVAAHHRQWWANLSRLMPSRNIIVQPRARGTANGILLPLLQIMHRDPEASLLVLPSDHHVRNESVLAAGMQQAMGHAGRSRDDIVLLGFAPEEADPELGYILPGGDPGSGTRRVRQFIEKPSAISARALIQCGGLWNSFIFAASGRALLNLFEERCPEIVMEIRGVVALTADDAMRRARLAELYERLPVLDFSRDIVERSASRLRVIAVPHCGWSDLGTPRRVAAALGRGWHKARSMTSAAVHTDGFLDLHAQHAQHSTAG